VVSGGEVFPVKLFKCFVVTGTLVAALTVVGGSAALSRSGPITKQNGSTPVFNGFTSICAVAGYASYGNCNGDTTKYTDVSGRINAVQAKVGVWNLGLSFAHLQPGASYKLWGNRTTAVPGTITGFFPIATVVAALDGTARFSYQTADPSGLGFDLNILDNQSDLYGITVVTSYWSNQAIQVLNSDGTLYVPNS
jgi:hypothetical protein